MRFARILSEFATDGATNRSAAAKSGNFSLNAASFLRSFKVYTLAVIFLEHRL